MKRQLFDKDWVDAYFDHGIDIANRRVFLDQDIDHDSVGAVVKGLYLMETDNSSEPIEMFISSYGGCIYEALALYDIINTIKCPIHTFGYGKIMSAAVLLIAAGEPGCRWIAPHVAFMHHDWNAEVEGKAQDLQTVVRHYEAISQQWTKLLAKHTDKDVKWWNVRAKKPADFYFTADEALEWGVADSMWVEKNMPDD
jgi:ATP-dependent Clp protease protease subunit